MIKIKNLHKSFGNKKVIENLSLEIPSNQLTFVVGKSGIGKSTLLKLISGYEKADSGSIDFVGFNNFNFRNIDFVFQDFNLVKGLTALENMQIGVNTLGLKFDKSKAISILDKINIGEKEQNQKIENLSGGEQQRVAIARSILRNSQILLTDEPTGNLDFENSEIIFEYLKEISKNKTVVVVTHDIENARKYGDSIIEIKKDEIKQYDLNQDVSMSNSVFKTSNLASTTNNLNKLRLVPKFVKTDIKRKIFQMIFLVFAFVATVIAFGTLTQLRFGIETKNQVLKTSYLQTDKIDAENKNKYLGFYQQDLDLFEKLPNLKYLSKSYAYKGARLSYGNNTNSKVIDFQFIDFNDFYKARMADNITLGNFPTNDNEIIISKKLVSELGIQDPIGKTIMYHDESDDGETFNLVKELKIVAVNDITNYKGENSSFLSNEFIRKINQYKLSNSKNIHLLKKIHEESSEGFHAKVYGAFYSEEFKILENLPSQIIKNNIKIEKNFLPIYISKNIVEKEKLKLNDKINSDFLSRQLMFNLAGIIDTNKDTVAISKMTYDKYSQVVPTEISLYFNNDVNTSKYIKQLRNDPKYSKYSLFSNVSSFAIEFMVSMNNIFFVFEIIIGVLVIISILFTLGFAKILNDAKRRDIGLLKSLGASLKQILMYHVSYFVLINIFVLILSMSLFVPAQIIFISFFENSDKVALNYSIGFTHLLIMWSINFGITTLIYSLFSYIKFRKNISNLIR